MYSYFINFTDNKSKQAEEEIDIESMQFFFHCDKNQEIHVNNETDEQFTCCGLNEQSHNFLVICMRSMRFEVVLET